MVYFVQPTVGGPIKIGFSVDVEARRRALEKWYKQPMALLGTIPGGRAEEREIHQRFAHLRFGRTEQFRPSPDLLAFIGRPLLVDQDPDAVEAINPGIKPIRLDFDPETHRMLRVLAAEAGLTIAEYAKRLLMEEIDRLAAKYGFMR